MVTSRSDHAGRASDPDDRPPDDLGLLSSEETKVLEAVLASDIWHALQDAFCWRREQIYNESPTSTEQLWKQRGQLDEIQTLLHSGPALVVQYRRFMQANSGTTSSTIPNDEHDVPDI